MGRKPQVGDVWRLADATVVAVDDDDDSVTIDFGPEGNFGLLAEELLAHATLVKAAERPLAVGDKAMWLESRARVEIIDIFERKSTKFAVVEALNRPSWEQPFDVVRLDELRRAETP